MATDTHPAVVLLITHVISADILKEYRKLRREVGQRHNVVLLYNVTNVDQMEALPDDIFASRFTLADLADFPYKNKLPVLSSYNVDLFLMLYAKRNPWYQYYWAIEYDVRFSGCWDLLFSAFADSHADLLGTTICRYEHVPDWANWRSLTTPRGLPRIHWLRGFFPIYRLSAAAIEAIDEAYREGWGGHFEATVPTILARAGMSIEDIGGAGPFVDPANINRFYDNTPTDPNLSPGSFVYRPIRIAAGARPNRLWHPVREPTIDSWALGYRDRLLRQAKSWMKTGERPPSQNNH